MAVHFISTFLFFIYLCNIVTSVMFMLPSGSTRCLFGEVHKDVLVTGEYEILGLHNAPSAISLRVSDRRGQILYSKDEAVAGKFAFTTEDFEAYEVCFLAAKAKGSLDFEVKLVVRHGVEAKNYEELGKTEKLKPLEIELKRLEDLSLSIVSDFNYMKKREEQMRDTNESTNTRVFYLSLFSVLCLFTLATWQVVYLRRYFKSKKLID